MRTRTPPPTFTVWQASAAGERAGDAGRQPGAAAAEADVQAGWHHVHQAGGRRGGVQRPIQVGGGAGRLRAAGSGHRGVCATPTHHTAGIPGLHVRKGTGA